MSSKVDYNKLQLIDLHYFGSIEFYSTLNRDTNYFFQSDFEYKKSLHPNRMWLIGPNNLLSLSVPLLGGRNQKLVFKDVRISWREDWRRIHWRTIHDAYRKSPWFEQYAPELEKLFQLKETFLTDWNLKTMEWVLHNLKLRVDILAATDEIIQKEGIKTNTNPGSEPANFYPTYQQVFMERQGFVSNLCVLDLLFCCGSSAIGYLEKLHLYLKEANNDL